MKHDLITDLHKLYFINFSDCFDTNQALMQQLMDRHGLYFKERKQIRASAYWNDDADVAAKFFDEICPGIVLGETQFAMACEEYMDFARWEQVKAAEQALKRINIAGNPAQYLTPAA